MDALIAKIVEAIINPLISFLFALAVLFFLYGVVVFIMNQDNEEKKTTGKKHMLWGIIGITIMMGVWFFLNLILRTFNIEGITIEDGHVEVELPQAEEQE